MKGKHEVVYKNKKHTFVFVWDEHACSRRRRPMWASSYLTLPWHSLWHLLALPGHREVVLVTEQDLMFVVLGSSHFSCGDIYVFTDISLKNKLTSGNTPILRHYPESQGTEKWDGTSRLCRCHHREGHQSFPRNHGQRETCQVRWEYVSIFKKESVWKWQIKEPGVSSINILRKFCQNQLPLLSPH